MKLKDSLKIFFRYILLVLIALPGLFIFYFIFAPLTIYPSYGILSIFYRSLLLENHSFMFNQYTIEIIPACIAGSAYYLLLILNLATPMKVKTRIKSLSFLFASLLLLNILRLIILSILFFSGFAYFDFAHKLFWYFGSTIFVVALWFLNVYLFKIKAIPAYTDLSTLFKETRRKR